MCMIYFFRQSLIRSFYYQLNFLRYAMSFRSYKVKDIIFFPLYFRCFIFRRLGSHYTFGYYAYAFCFFMFPTILRKTFLFSLLTMSVLDEGEPICASCALISYPRLYLHRPIAISAMLNA